MKFPIFKFIENNLKIKNSPIVLYPYQKRFLKDQSDRRIVLKARQVGFSTTLAIESVVRIINPSKTVLLVSVSDRQSQELMDKVNYFLRQLRTTDILLPDGDKISPFELRRETKTEKIFETDSRIISLPNSPQTVCGYTADYGYIDEFAKFDKDQDMMNAIEPSLSRGGKLTLNSTPFGKRGVFYNIWEKAEESGYNKHKIPWTHCPDPNYKREVQKFQKSWDPISFAQEYEMKFVSEALSYYPYSITLPCIKDNLTNVASLDSKNYVAIGIDFGQKSSQSVAVTVEKVETQLENKKFPILIVRNITAWRLQTPYNQIEKDINRMYKDLNPTVIRVDHTGLGQSITEHLRTKLGAAVHGINFTNPIKEKMATELRTLFENRQIQIPRDTKLLHQLNSMERSVTELGTVRYKHAKGEHDDYVWALCLACLGMTRSRPFMGVR